MQNTWRGDETPLCNFLHRNKSVLRSSEPLWVKGQHRIFQRDDFYLTLSVKYLSSGGDWGQHPEGGAGSVVSV